MVAKHRTHVAPCAAGVSADLMRRALLRASAWASRTRLSQEGTGCAT